jgi:uncharacterized membrane protein (UPF0136 family)
MLKTNVMWVYVALLLLGGVMGYIKGKSTISLFSSLIFAILIALSLLGILIPLDYLPVFLAIIMIVFLIRLLKTRKFMPAGLMLVLTGIFLAVYLFIP